MGEFIYGLLANAVLPHKLRQTQVNEFANVSRITILLYDILINLEREKRLVWDAKFRASSVLYYVLRYPVIAFQVFTIFESHITSHCDSLYKFTFTLSITFTRIALCASFILRVYALLPKGILYYCLVAFLTAIGALSVALDVVQVTEVSCSQASSPIWLVLTFITLICFDVVSTGLMSWGIFLIIQHQDHRGVRAFTLRERFSRWRTPAIILRSGILYYLVISGLQLGAVILYWEPQGVYSLVLNNYLTPLSTILVSRFLLDLRELIHEDSRGSSTENEPDIVFAAPSNTDTQSRHTQGRSGNGSAGERSWKKPGHSFSWYRDFEFEFEFEPDNRRSRDEECPEIQMDSMSRPLEELIQRGRLVEGRLEEGKLE